MTAIALLDANGCSSPRCPLSSTEQSTLRAHAMQACEWKARIAVLCWWLRCVCGCTCVCARVWVCVREHCRRPLHPSHCIQNAYDYLVRLLRTTLPILREGSLVAGADHLFALLVLMMFGAALQGPRGRQPFRLCGQSFTRSTTSTRHCRCMPVGTLLVCWSCTCTVANWRSLFVLRRSAASHVQMQLVVSH
jgi:hypothetical protein